jgi:phage tail sheath protein FI
MRTLQHPGVYQEELLPEPAPAFRTGVPTFLGDVPRHGWELRPIGRFSQFLYGTGGHRDPYLHAAVRGFFENGGEICFVAPASFPDAFAAMDATGSDLVCWPGLMRNPEDAIAKQQMLVDYCDRSRERMAILDALPGQGLDDAVKQWRSLHGSNAALYFPWIRVPASTAKEVPPCGHVAGVYARVDRESGVFRAPANVEMEGVLDLQTVVTDAHQDRYDPHGVVNCLRAFPGRGIRVWGASTISRQIEWRYVSVRRLFITVGRWVNANLAGVALEPNDRLLWARIRRQLNTFLETLFRSGALKGASPAEAFFVRCDGTNNTPADRDAGRVIVEIGLAPAVPAEFVVARLVVGQARAAEESDQKE